MLSRTDVLCEACDAEFIIVSHSDEEPNMCPYCGVVLADDMDGEEE